MSSNFGSTLVKRALRNTYIHLVTQYLAELLSSHKVASVLPPLEAVLRLEILLNIEITGYEEAPRSPERVELTKEMGKD